MNDEEAKEKTKSRSIPIFHNGNSDDVNATEEDADMSKFFDSDFRDELDSMQL